MSISSPDSQGSLWPLTPTGCEPSPSANLTPAAKPSSPKPGRASRAGRTCEISTWPTPTKEDQKTDNVCDRMYQDAIREGIPIPTTAQRLRSTLKASGSSPLASLVSLPLGPGSSEARRMTAGSGRRLSAFLEKSSPLGRFSKILLESATWTSPEFYLRWKHTVTKQGCSVFQLAPLAPRTGGNGTGLWPTVRSEERQQHNSQDAGMSTGSMLMDAWQTPAQHQFEKWRQVGQETREELLLPGQVKATWPTPKSAEGGPDYAIADRPEIGGYSLPTALGTNAFGFPVPMGNFVDRLLTLSAWLMGYSPEYLRHWQKRTVRSSRR